MRVGRGDAHDVVDTRNPVRPSLSVAAAISGFSIIAVYCTYLSIYTIDVRTGLVATKESLKYYAQLLEGSRDYPFQWRLLGIYLVYAGETLTGLDPHTLDVAIKTALLVASSLLLFMFSRAYTSEVGALCAVAFYQLATIAGFSDQYAIFYTSDYALHVCWFGAVYLVRSERYAWAAVLTFVGAWAKETMVLVPVLVGLRVWRGRAPLSAVLLVTAAFAVPTVWLRLMYRAPLEKWAWWHQLFVNVPFLQSSVEAFAATVKNNVKVALLYNVFWILSFGVVLRTTDTFLKDLGLTAVVYLVLVYPVIALRELRHFLPLAILVLPLAIAAIERRSLAPSPTS